MIIESIDNFDDSKVVTIKSRDSSVVLTLDDSDTILWFWVYEYDSNIGEIVYSAQYDSCGILISKHLFVHENKNGCARIKEYTIFDQANNLVSRAEYTNDDLGRCVITRYFDREGNLEYLSEKQWDGYECVITIFRDKKGNQIQQPKEYVGP